MTEWTLTTLKEHLEILRKADQEALVLQASKYEDRLRKLNGEHATLLQMREDFVLREVYNKDMDRLMAERYQSRRDMEEGKAAATLAAQVARRNAVWAAAGMLIALIGWGLTLLFHYLPSR